MQRWLRSSVVALTVATGCVFSTGTAGAQVISLNTGVDAGGSVIARGDVDPFWKIAIDGGAAVSAIRGSLANECCGMESVGPFAGWITDPSQDVANNSSQTGWGTAWTTPVRLTRSFDLTNYDLSTVGLSGIWRVADNQTGFFLNGNLIVAGDTNDQFIFSNYADDNPFSVAVGSGFFNQGINTLEIVAYSGNGNWDGLYIDADVTGELSTAVPEPTTMALVGTALFGLAILRRRRRA